MGVRVVEGPEAALAELDGAIDAAFAVPVSCWNADERAVWLGGLQARRARIDALCVEAAGAAEAGGVEMSVPGARTLRQFVAEASNVFPGDVASDLRLAGWVSRWPSLAEAWRDGQITRRHVEAVRAMENPRSVAVLREAEPVLAAAAAQCRWKDFIAVCGRLLVYADPDGSLADERVRGRRCGIRVQADGTVTGSFRLDPVTGAACKAALDRETRRLAEIDADLTHPERRHRGYDQRLADALANLLAKGALRPDGTVPSPLVHVVVGLGVLEQSVRRAAAAAQGVWPAGADGELLDADLHIHPEDPRRRCELVDGTPLHPGHVVGLLGVATLRRLVLGARGEVLDLGRSVRLFPTHLKQALLARDRGRCGQAGCDAPLGWLQADHVIPWSRGGPTSVANGQIRCAADNKAKGVRIDQPTHTGDPPRAA